MERYFDNILHYLRIARHERLELLYDPICGARCVLAFHHTGNEHTVGVIRRAVMSKPEREVIGDVLNLSREMSFRCAVAQLPCGGACFGFQAPAVSKENIDSLLGFLGYVTERYPVRWGVEAGFSTEELSKLTRFAPHLVTSDKGNAEQINWCAAYSVYACIKESLKFRYGNDDLTGKVVGIEGLGKLGSKLAEMLLQDGADIIVADINPNQVEDFFKKQDAAKTSSVSTVSLGEIRMQMGHVFAPCGYSGAISRDSLREIEYHILVGGANHLLQADTVEEELLLANLLMKKGILYIPDWISNMGAVLFGTALFLSEKSPEIQEIQNTISKICAPLVNKILTQSKQKGISPLQEAYRQFEPIVYHPKK